MPLDFPNSPTTGDLFNGAGVTWRWDGVKWTSVLSSGGPFLPLSGGTLSTSASMPSQIIIAPTPPSQANTPNGAQFASYLTTQYTGGNFNDPIFSNTLVNTNVGGAHDTGIWGLYSGLTYTGTGGKGGHVAVSGQAVRSRNNAGGTANNPQMWGALFNYIDQTNSDSAANNYGSAVEIGMAAGGTDSANNRRMLGMYLNKWLNTDTDPVCHMGIQLAANSGSFDLMLQLYGTYNTAAIDLRSATNGNAAARALWLKTGGSIAWNTTGDRITYYDPTVWGTGGVRTTAATQFDGPVRVTSGAVIDGGVQLATTLGVTGNTTLNGDVTINTGASVNARVVYTSARTYWAGSWSDGNFYLIDATGAPTIRLTVPSTGGLIITGGGLNADGAVGFASSLTVGGTSTLQGAVTAQAGLTSSTQLQIGVGGPTWTAGTAVPSAAMPAGSMYSRINGATGARFYICNGAGAWTPVPGV
jgi:hypothetical protein